MKKKLIVIVFLVILIKWSIAQVNINSDGSFPNNAAMLDVKSGSKGMLMPRLTSEQITQIQSPEDGLQVYNTDVGSIYLYVASSGAWRELQRASSTITPFVCGNAFTDTRDGKTYNTVQIGSQCWMAQNLDVGTMINQGIQSNNGIIEKYCYQHYQSNCDVYGGLYRWEELMNYNPSSSTNPSGVQGICPDGWHIPSDAEWCQLESFLDPSANCTQVQGWVGVDVGGKLKEAGTEHWAYPNTGANNASGFSALPGGYCSDDPYFFFNYLDYICFFYSSTESSPSYAWMHYLTNETAKVGHVWNGKTDSFHARCLKD